MLKAKIDSAYLDAELILAFVLGKTRSYILSHTELTINRLQEKRYTSLILQRAKFLPVAYILGYKEFYGLKFKVTKDTLVPRPESELLVEEAIKVAHKQSIIIDIGTGSGCLIISIIKNTGLKGFGLDISSKALVAAKQNAQDNKVNKNIKFLKSNLLSNLKISNNKSLVILANLPYLKKSEMKEKSISREPKNALYGGVDGLIYYKKLAKQLKNYSNYTLLCEINPGQKNGFKKLFPKSTFMTDFSGKIRLGIISTVIPAKAGTQGRNGRSLINIF